MTVVTWKNGVRTERDMTAEEIEAMSKRSELHDSEDAQAQLETLKAQSELLRERIAELEKMIGA